MTKYLIFVPEGGLCNRLMSINSARALAADLGAQLRVLWVLNEGCNCPFDKLFTPIDVEVRSVRQCQWMAFVTKIKRKNRFMAKMFDLIEPIFGLRVVDSIRLYEWVESKADIVRKIGSRRTICLSSWVAFYKEPSYGGFTPIEELQTRIDRQCDWGARQVVGVHVRRTDNVEAIEHSPLELYVQTMQSYPPDVHFFVATDSQEVKNELQALFVDRIITSDGELSRNSCGGMQQAVVDLYSLARCRALLASHWSSYSDAAVDIGKIEMIKIKK